MSTEAKRGSIFYYMIIFYSIRNKDEMKTSFGKGETQYYFHGIEMIKLNAFHQIC